MEELFDTYLTFSLGKEYFAINVDQVEKILEFQPVTEVPKSPEYMLGVFNMRGEVIPMIDTRIKFGMEKTEVTASTCILVITIDNEGEKIKLGSLVDSVNEVVKYNKNEIIPLPTVGKQNKAEFLHGVLKHGDKFILLVNADKIFSVDEIIELRAENFDLKDL
jgi:purine-binding chemotaxis protein CheW